MKINSLKIVAALTFVAILFLGLFQNHRYQSEPLCNDKYQTIGQCPFISLDIKSAKAQEVVEACQSMCDAANYVKIGRYFLGQASWEESWWISSNWAPGLPAVAAVIFALSGESHYLLKCLLLCALVWVFAIHFVCSKFPLKKQIFVFFAINLSLFLLPTLS